MKLLTWIWNQSGKMTLSGLQAVGLSAAVGLAGIGAWQLLSAPEDVNPNTAFSSGADEEVVLVAGGAAGGAYSGVGYGEGGEVRSGIRATLSKDMQLMNSDLQRVQIPDTPQLIQDEQKIQAFKMDGATEGLGLAAHGAAAAAGVGPNGAMGSLQEQIAALEANAKAQAAQAQAAAGKDAVAAAAETLNQSAAGKYGRNAAMARAGGHNLNATPLQASTGREGETLRGGVLGGNQVNPRLAAASGPVAAFPGGRDAAVLEGRRFSGMNSLEGLRKQSAEVAANRNRSVNEGTRVFMGGEKLSGGIQLVGENVTTGGGASSEDFKNVSMPNLSGVKSDVEGYETARENLRRDIRDFVKSCNRWSYVPIFLDVGTRALWKKRARNTLNRKISSFRSAWGDTSYEKNNSQGEYADMASKVVKKMLGAMYTPGRPKALAQRYSVQFFAVDGAFWKKNWETPTDQEKADFRKKYSNSIQYSGALRDHYAKEVN